MNKIPKIIHYCWFGGKPKSKLIKKCLESWKKHLPDYEIKEWNESNFNINSNQFVKEAYHAKRFAFVSDFVRLYALFNEGGIYMDTDVEVLDTLNSFLGHTAFSGFEDNNFVTTGIMASIPGGQWVKDNLTFYENLKFISENGTYNIVPNPVIITRNLERFGLKRDNRFQDIPDLITLYPSDYFCPKSWSSGKIHITNNTKTIHHFAGSWLSKGEKIKGKILRFYRTVKHKFQ